MNSENPLHHDWVVSWFHHIEIAPRFFLHCFLALLPTGFFLFFCPDEANHSSPLFLSLFLSFSSFLFIWIRYTCFYVYRFSHVHFRWSWRSHVVEDSQVVSAKKDCEEETRREKKGASHFFFPLYSFCFLYVFRLSCVPIPTENAHQIFGYRLVVRFLLLSPSPPFLFCLFLFPNSSTRSIYCKSAGFRRLIRQVQDHKIRVSLFMSRQLHTRRIV